MNTIGFPKASKNGEKRLGILPKDLVNVKNTDKIFIEENYGVDLGIFDEEYQKLGCNIAKREEVLQCDIVCDPKIGDATYIEQLKDNTVIWGWIHAVQNPKLAKLLAAKKIDSYAWEDMFEDNQHSFYKNNELAGKAAVLHALLLHGTHAHNADVAILGRGNTGRGAYDILSKLGADITVYSRRQEDLFKKEMFNYDIIVNSILWDTSRSDHIIYEQDLEKLRNHALIIDVSCDRNGGVETSIPTSIKDPIYEKHGVIHYVVDNTPSLLYRESSKAISEVVAKYIDNFIEGNLPKIINDSCIIKNGNYLDQRIINYQKLHDSK